MVDFFHNFDRFSLALFTEAATRGVLCKKLFLDILQNSQEHGCARASFLPEPQPASLLKKGLWYRFQFSCEICEISKDIFFI